MVVKWSPELDFGTGSFRGLYPWVKVPVSIVFGPFLSCKASLSSASQPPYSYYVAYVLNVFTTIHISITYEPGNEAVSKDK